MKPFLRRKRGFVKFFRGKNLTRNCGKIYTGQKPAARRNAADCRLSFLSRGIAARFTLFPTRYYVPRKGKKGITSDGIFADLLLSPSSRSARHLPFPKGEAWGKAPRTSYHKGRWGERAKRKGDNVLHRRYAFRPSQANPVTLKRGEGLQIPAESGSFGEGSVHRST